MQPNCIFKVGTPSNQNKALSTHCPIKLLPLVQDQLLFTPISNYKPANHPTQNHPDEQEVHYSGHTQTFPAIVTV